MTAWIRALIYLGQYVPHLVLLKPKKSQPRLPLNIGIWTAVRRTPRKDDIDRNNKLNNKIAIISIEQTAMHHSNRHVALASSVFKTRLLMKLLITLFFCLCATYLLLNSLDFVVVHNSMLLPVRFKSRSFDDGDDDVDDEQLFFMIINNTQHNSLLPPPSAAYNAINLDNEQTTVRPTTTHWTLNWF